MNTKKLLATVLPVMFGFVIMAFVDVAGFATNYIKEQFSLTDTVAGLIPSACFVWFFIFSVPTGIAMNKIGRKPIVLCSFLVTILSMLIPYFFKESLAMILVAFALLGIGNALLQVSLNALVQDVVSKESLTGTLTIGQALKSVTCVLVPVLIPLFATTLGWQFALVIFGIISLVAAVWLWFAPVPKTIDPNANLSIKGTLDLLKDKTILLFFLGILALVGIDVGTSKTFPLLMQEKTGIDLNGSTTLTFVYPLAKAAIAFCGGVLLMKLKEGKFYAISSIVAFLGYLGMIFFQSKGMLIASLVCFGCGYANLFSIIFGLALKHAPERSNEVSALLVTGIAGGALVTPLLGVVTDAFKSQTAGAVLLAVITLYILYLILHVNKVANAE